MKVVHLINSTYQVVTNNDYFELLFQGSLSDCESFIRLTESGYL